jgi:2-polyprenyl-3-methyl-5-hydroxy-6-metoxy-1,4-benzoquinol methylase
MTGDGSGSPPPPGDPPVASPDQRFRRLYAEGPGRAGTKQSWFSRPFGRLLAHLTHPLRDHQRKIDLALLDASHQALDTSHEAAAETEQVREEAVAAQGQALEATELAAQAVAEATSLREVIGSVADTSTAFHRRTEDLEVRLDVAVSLNDELSLAVDALRSDVQADDLAAVASQNHLEELERIKGSLVASTEELFRTTIALAQEVADIRSEIVAQREAAGRMEFIYRDLTSMPFMTRADGLRVEDGQGRQVMGYREGWHSPPMSLGFEQTFRGDETMIRDRQRGYVDLLRHAGPVVDLGAGRGEMLELLAEAGVPAIGVDLDPDLADHARAKGLAMECLDAFEYLDKQPDGSLGSVFSAQFIEHLSGQQLISLIRLTHRKLAAGGLMVAETVNPHSPRALKAFWIDLSHAHPIFPESLVVWCGLAGFTEATVHFPLGSGDLDADLPTQGEYAVVARKAP